jgi:hypothetical protein
MKIVNNKKEIFNMKRLVLLFMFLPAAYFASGQMPGTPYGVRGLNCSAAPATPGTLTLSASTVNLNGTFKASVPEVTTGTQKPTSYNWTLPSGLTGTSSTREITITGATAGNYATGTIKVKATNACGTSSDKTSASAVTVRVCSAAPAIPGTITLSPTTVNLNGTFTASVPEVTGTTAPTSYTWTLPSGLTGSSTSRTITITGATAGTYATGTIKVKATNACGTGGERSSASAILVKPPACAGYTATGCAFSGPSDTGNTIASGSYKSDVNASGLFTSIGDLCVTSKFDTQLTRAAAITACDNLVRDGASDWRLPNLAEIVNIGGGYATPLGTSGIYWVITTRVGGTVYWRFQPSEGYAFAQYSDSEHPYVCVRSM